MKKIIAALIVVALVLSSIFVLVACDGNKSEVEKAIEAAQKMTLEQLEAASRKEFEDNPEAVFNADSLTSGVQKALNKFIEKYEWLTADNAKYNSKKGKDYQPKLTAAAEANSYIADFVMIQDAAFVDALVKENFLLSYVPSGSEFDIAAGDQKPLVGVTFNKVFMYNKVNGGADKLKNVWQLTGADGATLQGIKDVSYQSPLGEDVNMSFLIMLTSPAACEKLTAAYKTYFGADYDASKDDYVNIGYKFAAEFIKNIKYFHKSDTDEVKAINTNPGTGDGRVVFAGLCKLKDYAGYKVQPGEPGYYKETVSAAGWNNDVEGFPGFIYNMWTLIPATAKLPYTASLFIRYLLTEEGFNAGFGGILGYYSANQKIGSVEGDPALSVWKQNAIVEDVDYINSVYGTVVKFINQQLA